MYFDVEVAGSGSDGSFVRLPLVGLGTLRNMILTTAETFPEAPPQAIHSLVVSFSLQFAPLLLFPPKNNNNNKKKTIFNKKMMKNVGEKIN